MRKYIEDLTNDLIRRNRFDQVYDQPYPEDYQLGKRHLFLHQIFPGLLAGDVAKMSPETLGKIMGALEQDEAFMVLPQEMIEFAKTWSSPVECLRKVVAYFLSSVIYERLDRDPEVDTAEYRKMYGGLNIPAYRRRKSA
ncbi:MAG: hypothetical protein WDN10_04435 [bacterium]